MLGKVFSLFNMTLLFLGAQPSSAFYRIDPKAQRFDGYDVYKRFGPVPMGVVDKRSDIMVKRSVPLSASVPIQVVLIDNGDSTMDQLQNEDASSAKLNKLNQVSNWQKAMRSWLRGRRGYQVYRFNAPDWTSQSPNPASESNDDVYIYPPRMQYQEYYDVV